MRPKIVLDANLTILFAVGATKRDYIASHKRLRTYDAKDFDILSGLIADSSGVIFSPNVLSETSNLVRYASDPARFEVGTVLAQIIARSEERYVASKTAALRTEYPRLGLTDAVLLELLQPGLLLLTADLDLYLAASKAKLDVINFNHVREQRPDFR